MQVLVPERPCLRPVEAIPDPGSGRVILRDPTQIAAGLLVVGRGELSLLALLDGQRGWREIQAEFARVSGQILLSHELVALLEKLDAAGFLAGPGFEAYYSRLLEQYRALPHRPLRDPQGLGVPVEELPAFFEAALDEAEPADSTQEGELRGIVTPHLDYPRGLPCYAAGYRRLRGSLAPAPRRVVVLGTNHFGRSSSVVATTKDFLTPWGVLRADQAFIGRLQEACGGSLMPYELDHLREHSVELQALWVHHLLGPEVRIVPLLCPDPSGSRGTAAGDPEGIDLKVFAMELGRMISEDPEPTLLVAGADLSHVGGFFGDRLMLEEGFLSAVRQADRNALRFVEGNDPEALREHMTSTGNPTRWCSVGCLYALMTALGAAARVEALAYHQAAVPQVQNCVTCAAYAFYA